MRARSFLIKIFGFLFAVGLCPWLSATPAIASSDVPAYSQLIFSDFDGDNKVDQAELFSNGTQKRIQVSLGRFAWQSLSFDSDATDRGRLVTRDIDNDGDTDLIWVSEDSPKKFVTWLGDGRGNFSLAPETEQKLRHLEGLLWNDAEPRTIQSVDGQELWCVLNTSSHAAILTAAYGSCVASSERSFSIKPATGIFAPGLSIIRKRGPPSSFLK